MIQINCQTKEKLLLFHRMCYHKNAQSDVTVTLLCDTLVNQCDMRDQCDQNVHVMWHMCDMRHVWHAIHAPRVTCNTCDTRVTCNTCDMRHVTCNMCVDWCDTGDQHCFHTTVSIPLSQLSSKAPKLSSQTVHVPPNAANISIIYKFTIVSIQIYKFVTSADSSSSYTLANFETVSD